MSMIDYSRTWTARRDSDGKHIAIYEVSRTDSGETNIFYGDRENAREFFAMLLGYGLSKLPDGVIDPSIVSGSRNTLL